MQLTADRRHRVLTLTRKGRTFVEKLMARRSGRLAEIVARMSDTDREALMLALTPFNEAATTDLYPPATRHRPRPTPARVGHLTVTTTNEPCGCRPGCPPTWVLPLRHPKQRHYAGTAPDPTHSHPDERTAPRQEQRDPHSHVRTGRSPGVRSCRCQAARSGYRLGASSKAATLQRRNP